MGSGRLFGDELDLRAVGDRRVLCLRVPMARKDPSARPSSANHSYHHHREFLAGRVVGSHRLLRRCGDD